jgi:hypothetical protein
MEKNQGGLGRLGSPTAVLYVVGWLEGSHARRQSYEQSLLFPPATDETDGEEAKLEAEERSDALVLATTVHILFPLLFSPPTAFGADGREVAVPFAAALHFTTQRKSQNCPRNKPFKKILIFPIF